MNTDTRAKREIAADMVDEMFSDRPRITIADAVAHAAEHGVSRTTIGRAMASKGVRTIRNGRSGGIWARPE
jgi:hypothetical protein